MISVFFAKGGNMKKIIILLIILSISVTAYAQRTNLYVSIDVWRHETGIEDSGNAGAGIGGEYLLNLVEERFYMGLGAEWKSPLDGFENDIDYHPIPMFLVGKLLIGTSNYYLVGRGGYSYNKEGDNVVDSGPYAGAGFGYDFTRIYTEVMYEIFDTNDNDKLFNDGTLQITSIKIGYKF